MMMILKSTTVVLVALLGLASGVEYPCGKFKNNKAAQKMAEGGMKHSPCSNEMTKEIVVEHVSYWLGHIGCKCAEGPLGPPEALGFVEKCIKPHVGEIFAILAEWPACAFMVSFSLIHFQFYYPTN